MLRLPGSVCDPGEATDNLLWSGVHAVLCDWQGAEGTGELSEEVGGGGVFGFWGMICALYVCMYVCTTPYVCTWTKRICVCMCMWMFMFLCSVFVFVMFTRTPTLITFKTFTLIFVLSRFSGYVLELAFVFIVAFAIVTHQVGILETHMRLGFGLG